jgi:hypothetical protein
MWPRWPAIVSLSCSLASATMPVYVARAQTDRQTDKHMYYIGTARVCGLMFTHARGTADAGDVRHALPRRLWRAYRCCRLRGKDLGTAHAHTPTGRERERGRHTHIHTHRHTYITYTQAHTYIHTHMHTHAHIHMHAHAHIQNNRHVCMCACVRTYVHTYIHSLLTLLDCSCFRGVVRYRWRWWRAGCWHGCGTGSSCPACARPSPSTATCGAIPIRTLHPLMRRHRYMHAYAHRGAAAPHVPAPMLPSHLPAEYTHY